MSDDGLPPPETLGYRNALTELEAILDELEGDAVDVDVLANRVKRAAELIRFCRQRIAAARLDVEAVVADLENTDPVPDRP